MYILLSLPASSHFYKLSLPDSPTPSKSADCRRDPAFRCPRDFRMLSWASGATSHFKHGSTTVVAFAGKGCGTGFAPEHNRDIQTQDEARGVCMTMGIARPHACAGGTIPWNGRGAGGMQALWHTLPYMSFCLLRLA